jgi:hypothetical protein
MQRILKQLFSNALSAVVGMYRQGADVCFINDEPKSNIPNNPQPAILINLGDFQARGLIIFQLKPLGSF